jgi:hypothetical protein
MKWFERNIIWITFGIMALALMVQMIYIQQIKSELRLFNQKEQVIIKNKRHE